jgi:hypothetical protein
VLRTRVRLPAPPPNPPPRAAETAAWGTGRSGAGVFLIAATRPQRGPRTGEPCHCRVGLSFAHEVDLVTTPPWYGGDGGSIPPLGSTGARPWGHPDSKSGGAGSIPVAPAIFTVMWSPWPRGEVPGCNPGHTGSIPVGLSSSLRPIGQDSRLLPGRCGFESCRERRARSARPGPSQAV